MGDRVVARLGRSCCQASRAFTVKVYVPGVEVLIAAPLATVPAHSTTAIRRRSTRTRRSPAGPACSGAFGRRHDIDRRARGVLGHGDARQRREPHHYCQHTHPWPDHEHPLQNRRTPRTRRQLSWTAGLRCQPPFVGTGRKCYRAPVGSPAPSRQRFLRLSRAQRERQRLGVRARAERVIGVDRWLNSIVSASLEIGRSTSAGSAARPRSRRCCTAVPVLAALRARAWSGCARENAPLTRRPVAVELGSETLSSASPADEITLPVVDAV